MTRTLVALFDSGSPLLVVLLEVTLLLGLAALVAAGLRRQSAAARHFVWALALGGALVLPLLVRVAPRSALPLPVLTLPAPAAAPNLTLDPTPTSDHAFVRTPRSLASLGGPGSEGPRAPSHRLETVGATPAWWLGLLWLAGCVTLLLRMVLGHAGIARLSRRAAPLVGSPWPRLLQEAQHRTGVTTRVRLFESDSVGAPITWGWTTPVVVLPTSADSWPIDRRRAALEHELAHVARRDYVTQLGGMLAAAIYWFHPFVWFAVRRLRTESEHACDDRVLAAGTNAPEYATHLLEVARGAQRLRFAESTAVCMAHRSHLEVRLCALLDDARSRRTFPRWIGLAATLALALLLVPVAGLRPALRTATAATSSADAGSGGSKKSRASDSDSSFEKSLDASPGEMLSMELDTGGSIVVRGWDQNRVQVNVGLGGEDWRDTEVEIDRERDGVRVGSMQERHRRSGSSTSHRFEIRVPKKFDLHLRSAGGGVEIRDVEGTFRGSTGGGDIVLENVAGDVRLSTGGGEIHVTDVDASGLVQTGGGLVRLSRVRGGLRGSSGSGPVIHSESADEDSKPGRRGDVGDLEGVRVSGSDIHDGRTGQGGRLHIERAGGDVSLDEAPNGARIQTGGGKIHVRRGAGSIEATTGGGDIEIGPIAGSVSAQTGAGDVEVTLVDAKGEEQNVEVAAGVGNIVVWLPQNFAGRFDLETAYTRSHRSATKIQSDWTVERDETTDWDDSQGTARRYVRARGKVGDGSGVVRIRTVNGDISVKRGRADR